jgi:Domain of unknown function (DUF397)
MSALELPRVAWRKSSRSDSASGCVEVARAGHTAAESNVGERTAFLVRDSKDPEGPILSFTSNAWAAFIANVKEDKFDIL